MQRQPPPIRFADRDAAGKALGALLHEYADRRDVLVLGLPRGGVPVAARVAEILGAALDICVVRKLGVPGHEEYAMGAIASGGVIELNERVVRELGLSKEAVRAVVALETAELARRERAYRHGIAPHDVRDRIVILVDDGLATGSTMRAAVNAVRAGLPSRLVVAVPIATREACATFARLVDECVCARTPEPFHSVGEWYVDFEPTTDEEVLACLARAQRRSMPHPTKRGPHATP